MFSLINILNCLLPLIFVPKHICTRLTILTGSKNNHKIKVCILYLIYCNYYHIYPMTFFLHISPSLFCHGTAFISYNLRAPLSSYCLLLLAECKHGVALIFFRLLSINVVLTMDFYFQSLTELRCRSFAACCDVPARWLIMKHYLLA